MNDIEQAVVTAGLAALVPVVPTPAPPFGWGVDIVCGLDLDPMLAETDPFSPIGIGLAVVRRWDCPRGALPPDGKDATDYGVDLRSYCSRGMTDRDVNALADVLAGEARKDDRVALIKIDIVPTQRGALVDLAITARITPADSGNVFSLILAVTSADIVIKAIEGVTT